MTSNEDASPEDVRAALNHVVRGEARITDPELRLMFLCCHPSLSGIDQVVLTLRTVSGFSAQEIAQLFRSREGAIARRLARCKSKLRRLDAALANAPSVFEVETRLDAVLKVVYLMFSLGYAPRSGAEAVRRDVAAEALRLARELADGKTTSTPVARALAALLCLQASRFDAREDINGSLVPFRHQNCADWDRELIGLGLAYLEAAMAGGRATRYHLEAGIASIYATAPSWERIDWDAVLAYYAKLEAVADSPVVTINAAVAEAFAGRPKRALRRLETLDPESALEDYAPYHIARAEVLRMLGREIEANISYSAALSRGVSAPVIRHLEARLLSSL